METNFYLDVDKFAKFLGDLSDEVPNTPLTRGLVIRIIDYVEQNMESRPFCPYGFTEVDREICEICKDM